LVRLALVHDGVLTRRARPLPWLIAVCGALAGPGSAGAHSRAPTTALDYRLQVAPMPAPLAGVRADVLDGDRELRLTVAPSVTLVVLGLVGEPFLRFGSDGVWVHGRSPTAAADRLVTPRGQGSGWIRLTRANELAWHDHRLAPPPNVPVGFSAPFALPVRVDGAPAVIRGSFTHVSRPRLWPWLLGAAVAVGALVAAARATPKRRGTFAARAAAVAAVAALVSSTGFATGTSITRFGDWVEVGSAAVLALGAAAVLWMPVRSGRTWSAILIGLIAASFSLSSLAIFWHGVVISSLPTTLARLSTGAAVLGGLAACVIGVLAAVDDEPRRRSIAGRTTAVRR
jgi:hypothetical protein